MLVEEKFAALHLSGTAGCPTLTELDFNWLGLQGQGLDRFTEALQQSASAKTLTALYISHNLLYDDGCAALANLLRARTEISFVQAGDNSISAEGIKVVGAALEVNRKLLTLEIPRNEVPPRPAPQRPAALTLRAPAARLLRPALRAARRG